MRARFCGARRIACLVGSLALLQAADAAAQPDLLVYGLTPSNGLVTFRSNSPGALQSAKAITGLQPGEQLRGIDLRPATGQLMGVGDSDRLYVIDPITAVATPVGAGPFAPSLTGAAFGFDFDPRLDQVRIVGETNQNFRINPNTGATAALGIAPAYAVGDPNFGVIPNLHALAYSTNVVGAPLTGLFAIDSGTHSLVIQTPPDTGMLHTVGELGVNFLNQSGFDIAPDGRALAVLKYILGPTNLYAINLQTGQATLVGAIGGAVDLRGIAIAPIANQADQDFDGDGKSDMAVFRQSTGEWWVRRSSDGGTTNATWGAPLATGLDDVPVPADYDGDGRVDFGIYRRTTGEWYVLRSSDGGTSVTTWGTPSSSGLGDVPVPADYDGDRRADFAIYRTTAGVWFVLKTTGGSTTIAWGVPGAGDVAVKR